LCAQRNLVFEKQAEPSGVIEAGAFFITGKHLKAFGHTVQPKRMQAVERGLCEHVFPFRTGWAERQAAPALRRWFS
jgi:hypothetical protein